MTVTVVVWLGLGSVDAIVVGREGQGKGGSTKKRSKKNDERGGGGGAVDTTISATLVRVFVFVQLVAVVAVTAVHVC